MQKKFKWKCYANEINTDCIKVLKKIIIDKKFQKIFMMQSHYGLCLNMFLIQMLYLKNL